MDGTNICLKCCKDSICAIFPTFAKLSFFSLQWLGLMFPLYAIYMDTCRECYEAYVRNVFNVSSVHHPFFLSIR